MLILYSFTSSLIHAQIWLLLYNKFGWFLDNLIGKKSFCKVSLSNIFLEVKIFLFSINFQLFPFGCYYHLFFLCFNWKSHQAKMSFQDMEVECQCMVPTSPLGSLPVVKKGSSFSSLGPYNQSYDSSFLRCLAVLWRVHFNIQILESEDVSEQYGLKEAFRWSSGPKKLNFSSKYNTFDIWGISVALEEWFSCLRHMPWPCCFLFFLLCFVLFYPPSLF